MLAIFGNTKYNKFSNTKFEGTCVYGICRAKPAVGGLPAMRRPGWLSCARGRGVVLRGMRASARAVFAAGTSEIEKKKAGNVLTNITCLVREMRLELTRLLPHAPQTCLSTYSSTLASANNIIAIDLLFVNRKFRTAAAAEKSHICRILRICARSRAARLKLHGRAAEERTRLLLRCLT